MAPSTQTLNCVVEALAEGRQPDLILSLVQHMKSVRGSTLRLVLWPHASLRQRGTDTGQAPSDLCLRAIISHCSCDACIYSASLPALTADWCIHHMVRA